jgi:protein required for attachment to host cells
MSICLVAVIDSTKARFLTLEPSDSSDSSAGFRLIEHKSLLNSASEVQGQDVWSSTKTGRNRGVTGQAHSYDDHRENHLIEFERRFAQTIATQIINLIQVHQAQQFLMVGEPQIFGLMREALTSGLPKKIKISELTKNLCHLKPHELHEYLAHKQLLPAQKRVSH